MARHLGRFLQEGEQAGSVVAVVEVLVDRCRRHALGLVDPGAEDGVLVLDWVGCSERGREEADGEREEHGLVVVGAGRRSFVVFRGSTLKGN